jgi:uncharacterized protein
MRLNLNLLPVDEKFFENLLKQAAMVASSTQMVATLFEQWSPDSPLLVELERLDQESEDMRHLIAKRVNETLVTPIDREDIYELTTHLNKLLVNVHQVALKVNVFNITEVTEHGRQLGVHLRDAGRLVEETVGRLPRFQDCGELRKRSLLCYRQGYEVYRQGLSQLFRQGHEPLYVFQWKDLYDSLEKALAECRTLCGVVEGVIIKHA